MKVAALMVLLPLGRAGPAAQLRQMGAAALDCPEGDVRLKQRAELEYRVIGCGKVIDYVCHEGSSGLVCPPTAVRELAGKSRDNFQVRAGAGMSLSRGSRG
jgi:hypothetical protein